ncbi:hypothetical protein [Oligoflexus tunisiensis]|uniref:hypothetical protein n=1 Tax=Oligoflexus tunisiensis TaxID=708132 RepID=UPI00114CE3C3|nr:hypothetical protein [Oligoflexus tunisiensis]
MSRKANKLVFVSGFALMVSCTAAPKAFDSSNAAGTNAPVVEAPTRTVDAAPAVDNRGPEQLLCEEGPKVTAAAKKADFSEQFKLICDGSKTTALFKETMAKAFAGTGEPAVNLLKSKTNPNFDTEMTMIYAIKAPLKSPSEFADLKPHDILAAGIKESGSEIFVTVESRKPFPGKGSLEQVVLNYDLRLANKASLFDKRRMEFNSYLLNETNRDIVVSTEHLLDVDKNEFYHKAQGLTIGIKGEDGQSYFVFITDIIIKNRIDTDRMKATLSNLNIGTARMLGEFLVSKASN